MKFGTQEQSNLNKYVVELDQCGPIEIYVEGDLSKFKSCSSVFLTLHDVGSSYHSWVTFTNHEDMKETKDRSLFLHVSLPGQLPGDYDLSADFEFPDLQKLGLNLVTVLDQLQVKHVVVLGDGAGANIACWFAMFHPRRASGLVLVNCNPDKGGNGIFSMFKGRENIDEKQKLKLNQKNVGRYEDVFRNREEISSSIASKMSVDTLLLTGRKSRTVQGCSNMQTQVKVGLCSFIAWEDVENVLEEATEKAADAIILFCQGLGLVSAVQRKLSRNTKDSTPSDTKLFVSMQQADVPNLMRLIAT